jgi:hypothetical protein
MADADLQRAIESLKIQDVYVRELTAKCLADFDPKHAEELDRLIVQRMHVVRESQVAELSDGNHLLRVFVRLGARWVMPEEAEEPSAVRALIEAEFVAEYRMDKVLDEAAINAFALRNASFHVWPYWRELLSNQCIRMHLPKLTLPMSQVADNHDAEEADAEADS